MTNFCGFLGHVWFEFKSWNGEGWVLARCCTRPSCRWENWYDGTAWVGVNLRKLRA